MKKKNSFLLVSWISFLFAALAFSGCNTMEGMGEDVERSGQEIQEQAR